MYKLICISAISLLLFLIILITVYITKIYNHGYITCKNIRDIENKEILNDRLSNVYDVDVTKEFKQMFTESSITSSYENINAI